MRHGRLRSALVVASVIALASSLWAAPAGADSPPATTPTITAPLDTATVNGDVTVSATSTAPSVQFYLDDVAFGALVTVVAGDAGVSWPTWSLANTAHTWTAADCDETGCNTTRSAPVTVTIANSPPTITAPVDTATVTGDVTITATAASPSVQFYLDDVAFGSPAPVSSTTAGVLWHTFSLANGPHAWTTSACDAIGCNATRSSTVNVTVGNPPPVFTAPPAGTVMGDVTVSTTSAAPSVQFFLDGTAFGVPAPVVGGSASVAWSTWGAVNTSHAWTAAECDGLGCSPTLSSTLTVTIGNAAPVLTAPLDGGKTGTSVTLQASAPGGGLAFFVDGTQVGFDATSPYSFTVPGPLTMGAHTATVKACDAFGVSCNGPSSATVTFTVTMLQPTITQVSPKLFSPRRDGRRDRTTFRVHLPDAQYVSFLVRNGNGQTVQGPHTPKLLGAGDHTYTWDGLNNSAKTVIDGTYTIVVTTSAVGGDASLHGTATATVRVDDTPTHFSGITPTGSITYPVVDGYNDNFRPRVHAGEGGRLWLEIYNHSGTRVRVIARVHAGPGTFQPSWNGRDAAGRIAPVGSYHFRFVAEDLAGNRSASANFGVRVSHKRTVRRTVKLSRNGEVGKVSTTDPYCTQYSLGLSIFKRGLWVNNSCDRGFDGIQTISAAYTFAVPGAVRYHDIRVRTFGETINAPEPVSASIYNFAGRAWDHVGSVSIRRNGTPALTTYGRVSGAQRVSLFHRVRVSIDLPDKVTPEDYDIARVEIIVAYDLLR